MRRERVGVELRDHALQKVRRQPVVADPTERQRRQRRVARRRRVHQHERQRDAVPRPQRLRLPDDHVQERVPVVNLDQRLGLLQPHRRRQPPVELDQRGLRERLARRRPRADPQTRARRRRAPGRRSPAAPRHLTAADGKRPRSCGSPRPAHRLRASCPRPGADRHARRSCPTLCTQRATDRHPRAISRRDLKRPVGHLRGRCHQTQHVAAEAAADQPRTERARAQQPFAGRLDRGRRHLHRGRAG